MATSFNNWKFSCLNFVLIKAGKKCMLNYRTKAFKSIEVQLLMVKMIYGGNSVNVLPAAYSKFMNT